MSKKLTAVSLFSGALGLDIGLDRAGFSICVAIENDKNAVETIKKNKHKLKNSKKIEIIDRDIHDVTVKDILNKCDAKVGEITLVTGGPACQTFSTAGSRTSLSDPRGNLFVEYIRIIKGLKPRFFVMENVKGILSAAIKHRPLNQRGPAFRKLSPEEELGSGFKKILIELQKTGYYIIFGLLNSADFGTPQKRERLIILGSRDGEPLHLPFKTHNEKGFGIIKKWVNLKEGLSGLQDSKPEYVPFSAKQRKYLEKIPQGGNWHNLPKQQQKVAIGGAYNSWGGRGGFLRRLAWGKPSPALTASPNSNATMLCHPTKTRPLSVKEYARLQQFPDNWVFSGSISNKYLQIGNAVPVGLGEAIGKAIVESMNPKLKSLESLGLIVCETPKILDNMAQRPTTFLNPPKMRKDPKGKTAKAWFGKSGRNRKDVADFISELGISSESRKIRKKTHKIVDLLSKEYKIVNSKNRRDILDELIFTQLSFGTSEEEALYVFNRLKNKFKKWSYFLNLDKKSLKIKIRDARIKNSSQNINRFTNILRSIEKQFKEANLDFLYEMSDKQVEKMLSSLVGIDINTAKKVMLYSSLNRKVLPVNAEIKRVSQRLGFIPSGLSIDQINDELDKIVAPEDRYEYYVNMISHGQQICLPKTPYCDNCVLRFRCKFRRK